MIQSLDKEEYIIENSIFTVGKVVSVEGQSVKVKIDKWKNTSFILYKWEVIQNIFVGWYIKIKKWFEEMIGKIEGEYIKEEKDFSKLYYKSNKEKINRIIVVKILWYIEDWEFKRGIKELPLIDNKCYLLKKEEFNEIHNFIKDKDEWIEIWSLEYDDWQIIEVGINSLFASHIWIFGNTWSGKSYTLAKIYRELFQKYKDKLEFKRNAKFFLIDFNGEYIGDNVIIERIYKDIHNLSTIGGWSKFPIKKDTVDDVSFWSIFLEATEKMQVPFLNRALKDTYLDSNLNTDEDVKELIKQKIFSATSISGKNIERNITVDFLFELYNYLWNDEISEIANYFKDNLFWWNERISFYLEEMWNYPWTPVFIQKVEAQINRLRSLQINWLSYIKKIGLKIIFKYYDEMIRGFSNREHLCGVIKRLEKRIQYLEEVIDVVPTLSVGSNNLTIISLKSIDDIGIRKIIPMLICKELYDSKKKDDNKNHSLHIIIDEAHNILSEHSNRESEQRKDYRLEVFEEIIKEWRKFWTFLTVASQRPSDISPTIISQLHNYFLHRLINNNDLLAVEKTISYLDKVSADSIPNLSTGTCIMAWLLAQIPVVVKINEIPEENVPISQTINLLSKWKQPNTIA